MERIQEWALRAAVAAASAGLGGCTMGWKVENSFTARHPECHSTSVRERSDLLSKLRATNPTGRAYEVSGCNMAEIYACSESHWEFRPCVDSNSTCGGLVPSACGTEPWLPQHPAAPASVAVALPYSRIAYTATEPPRGAAGFDLGAAPDAAQKRCVDSGKTWSLRDGGFACSGPATDVGFDATVRFGLCDNRICDISVVAPETAVSVHQYAELRTTLAQKYGDTWTAAPSENEAGCEGDALRGCLLTGRLKAETLWRWQTGEAVKLDLGKDPADPQHLQIRIDYHGQSVGAKPRLEAL
jgi:hypothetical protein